MRHRLLSLGLAVLAAAGLLTAPIAHAAAASPARLAAVPAAVVQDGNANVYLPAVANGQAIKQQPQSDAERAIALLAAQPIIAQYLAGYAGWRGDAYPDEGSATVWKVDFYQGDEWLGWGRADLASNAVVDYYVPRELTPEEFAAGKQKIETFLKYDPEVNARLQEPGLWGHEVTWNRWDQQWQVWYWYGIDALVVVATIDELGKVYLDSIRDPNQLKADEQAAANRNRAIELAYTADGVDTALAGHDDWKTYVEDQANGRYTVEFVSGEQTLLAALVDILQGIVVQHNP